MAIPLHLLYSLVIWSSQSDKITITVPLILLYISFATFQVTFHNESVMLSFVNHIHSTQLGVYSFVHWLQFISPVVVIFDQSRHVLHSNSDIIRRSVGFCLLISGLHHNAGPERPERYSVYRFGDNRTLCHPLVANGKQYNILGFKP